MSNQTLIARNAHNILADADVGDGSPSAVMDTYSLETLLTDNPAARVRFTGTSVSIVFTLATAQRGDVFVLPVHNLADGSPSNVLRLTNGAGLDVTVDVPAPRANGIPRTAIVDLVAAVPSAVTRTSDTWTVVISGNDVDVILGGAIYLFSEATALEKDLQWGFKQSVKAAVPTIQNDYLRRYRMNLRTQEETLEANIRTTASGAATLRDLFDANFGSALPGLLWPQIDAGNALANLDAYICVWDGEFEAVNVPGTEYVDVRVRFIELSNGKPV